MANYSNRVELNWVVGSQATAGKKTVDLLPFEFGVVDADTYQTVTGDLLGRSVLFAVGSPNQPQGTDGQRVNRLYNPHNTNVSFKSETVGKVSNLRFVTPDKQDLTQVYYLGYNGLDACESLNFECGQTYDFHIHVKGQTVQNTFGKYEMTEIVSVTAPCCDESCGCVDGKIDCHLVIDELVNRFKTDSFWVSRYFNVEKVMSCSPAVTIPTKVNYTKYCLTVCDNGDELSLAAVQNQYPTVVVSVKERKAPYTTYEFIQLAATAAPANFSQQDTILKDCTNCPSGYTAVTGGFAYIVEIDNTNADASLGAQLTAVQAVWATATYAEKKNFGYGTSTYYVVSSAALAAVTGDARIVRSLGVTAPKCQQTTPIATAWVSCGTFYKVSRDLILTKENDNCQTNPEELAELTAALAGRTDLVSGTLLVDAASTACIIRFNVSQYNNDYLVDGCDTYGFDGAKFDSLPTWKGFRWEVEPCVGWTVNGNGCPVPPAPDTACCQCGIKFTTKTFEEAIFEKLWDVQQFQVLDPIDLTVSAYKPDGSLLVCGTDIPTWRKTKAAKYQTLRGLDVIKQILITRNDRQERFLNQTDKEGLLYLEREGIKYGIKLTDYYFAVSITNEFTRHENYPGAQSKETVTLYIHENNQPLFESLRGTLTALFPSAKVTNL
jgi:hypothetical protein